MKRLRFLSNIILSSLAILLLVGCDSCEQNVFNVRDFGAKGDGKTSDTKAIQSAIDAAGKVQGTVYSPDGKYITFVLRYTG